MKILHKRLLGILSFILAIILFITLNRLSTDKAELVRKIMIIKNLDNVNFTREKRCFCVKLLSTIEEKLLNDEEYDRDILLFNIKCFPLPSFEPHKNMSKLLISYEHQSWSDDNMNYLFKIVMKFFDNDDALEKNKRALLFLYLEKKNIDKAIQIFKSMPSSNLSLAATQWSDNFKSFLNNIILLRRASSKIYESDEYIIY